MPNLKDELIKAGFSELAKFHIGAALTMIYHGISNAIGRTLAEAAVISYDSDTVQHPIVQALAALSRQAGSAIGTTFEQRQQSWNAVSTLARISYDYASELGLSPLIAAEIMNMRGWALLQQGFLYDAAECFRTVLGDDYAGRLPRHLLDRKALCNLAVVEFFCGKIEESFDLLDRADYHNFGFKSAHMNRLSFASRRRDEVAVSRGAKLLRKAIPNYAKDPEIRNYLLKQDDLAWMRSALDMKELFPELFAKSKGIKLSLDFAAVIAGSIGLTEIAGSIAGKF